MRASLWTFDIEILRSVDGGNLPPTTEAPPRPSGRRGRISERLSARSHDTTAPFAAECQSFLDNEIAHFSGACAQDDNARCRFQWLYGIIIRMSAVQVHPATALIEFCGAFREGRGWQQARQVPRSRSAGEAPPPHPPRAADPVRYWSADLSRTGDLWISLERETRSQRRLMATWVQYRPISAVGSGMSRALLNSAGERCRSMMLCGFHVILKFPLGRSLA